VIASVVALMVLSPLIGEYLLGNVPFELLPALPFLIPMYGGGALLIREVVRRTGRGWPSILLLGAAYGLVEAGLFDGSLFSQSYLPGELATQKRVAQVPGLGLSAVEAVRFVTGHAVWSIAIPIILAESLFPRRRCTPWLGNVGLVITAVVYVGGGLLIQSDSRGLGDFQTSIAQAIGTLVVVGILVGLALRIRRVQLGAAGRVPRPLVLGIGAFVWSSLYIFAPDSWLGVGLSLGCVLVAALGLMRLARRTAWSDRHRLAVAGGAVVTYAWVGFVLTELLGNGQTVNRIGNVILAMTAIGLVALATRRLRRHGDRSPDT
jgi:hypothetical protein